jgi:signal transduction histidine kinase/ActR/RegA family two-component response regulator
MPLDARELQAVDDRLALAGVLQELTVAALDLFDPSRSVDEFLQTVAARLGCHVAACLEVSEGRLSLLGSAGLARTSRDAILPLTTVAAVDAALVLPYREVGAPGLRQWTLRSDASHAGSPWWLVLYFAREPQLAVQYKGMLERLARQVSFAFEHRRLFNRLIERERNLRAASSRLRTLIAHLPTGIVAMEGDRIAQANEAFCRMMSLAPEMILGADASVVLGQVKLRFRDPEAFTERTAKILACGEVVIGEEPEELASGRFVERDYVPILADGVSVGRMWCFRDVTRAHRAAEEIQRLNEDLEQRVAERTRELGATQQRLAASDRMASIGTLAAGVAHEINNPLAYITANLEMILEELSRMGSTDRLDDVAKMANEAREGAERVRRIVGNLKTFSRSDEGPCVPVDLHRVLEQSITMAFNEIRHRARLEKDLGPLPLVAGDERRLGQVFVNLLVNAAQAIPPGQAQSNTIRVVTRTDKDRRAIVEVHDTGPGIAPEILGHVFDPFFTTKPVGVGTGLGLSICHGIIAALGGEITVESPPGRGTVFRVILAPASPAERQTELKPSLPVTSQKRARILVIDDEPMVRAALVRILKQQHDVTPVASGAEALDQIRSNRHFDVILCDLMMPDMTGMDLHAEIARTVPSLLERIVFMTGGAFTASAKAFLERITNELLEKPFPPTEVRALVGRILDRVET